jgi:hypothetical protein
MSPDGTRLFAVNTPNGQLEIYEIGGDELSLVDSVPVGLEPVALATRSDGEVWVVNHLSDSISIVDVAADPPRVVRTLLVGDEPRDIVFAGSEGSRAFIATAHRGQNSPYPQGEYDIEGTGRADVWVFDATALGTSLGGDPLTIITLFGDRPRALAATPDGSTVFAAVFRSGNRTMTVGEPIVCDTNATDDPCTIEGVQYPGGLPFPKTNFEGTQSREAGLVVGWNPSTELWEDELERDWSNAVRFSLPDLDVFAIDADAITPAETRSVSGVGTVLFNRMGRRSWLQGISRSAHGPRAPPRSTRDGDRWRTERAPEALEQTHRLCRPAAAFWYQRSQPVDAARNGDQQRRGHPLCRRLRLERDRDLRHGCARERQLRA